MPIPVRGPLIAIALILTLATGAVAETVSVPFRAGFIGTIGQNANKTTGILNFSTLKIATAHFTQESDNGQFGGTQGNDLSGTLRLAFEDKRVIEIPGAINWRISTSGVTEYFGFIPDPANAVKTFTYPGGTYTLNGTRNYAFRKIRSVLAFPDGVETSGNAALKGLIEELNIYLAEIRLNAPVILGPSGLPGAGSSSVSMPENQTKAATFTANKTAVWSIISGADAAFFVIDPATGVLSFKSPPDFETPLDANRDNIYLVNVGATDTNMAMNTQSSSVRVTDVDETIPEPEITTSKTVRAVSPPTGVFVCASDPAVAGSDLFTPGVCVEYRVDLASRANGSAPVQALTITDPIPPNMTFSSILGFSGFDTVTFSDNAVTAKRATFPAGASAQFTVRAHIK
jgi:hypothetical protein